MRHLRALDARRLESEVDEEGWAATTAHRSMIVDGSDPALGHLFAPVPHSNQELPERALAGDEVADQRRERAPWSPRAKAS